MKLELPTGDIWPDMIQGSDEWFAARKGRATASNFKKIVTPTGKLSAQAKAYQRVLARECVADNPFDFAGNKATDWGNENEPIAREAFMAETGYDVVQVGFVTHKHMTCVGCSPDGLIVSDDDHVLAGLEIKCPSPDTWIEWALDGNKVPDDHLTQCHGSMIVTGLRRWEFVAFFPGFPLFRAHVVWDEYTEKLKTAIEAFVIEYAETRGKILTLINK